MCIISLLDKKSCSIVADVGADQTSYTVSEDVGQLRVQISITSEVKDPGPECQIVIITIDRTAVGESKVTIWILKLTY